MRTPFFHTIPFTEEEKELLTIIKGIYDNFQFKKKETSSYEIIKAEKVLAAKTITISNKPLLMQAVLALCEKYIEILQSLKEENNLLSITLTPFSEKEKELLTIIKGIYDNFQFKKKETSSYEIIKDGKVIAARSITTSNKPLLMKVVLELCQYVEIIQSVKEENNLLIITLKTLSEKEKYFEPIKKKSLSQKIILINPLKNLIL